MSYLHVREFKRLEREIESLIIEAAFDELSSATEMIEYAQGLERLRNALVTAFGERLQKSRTFDASP
jgi:hypothetical protein